MRIRFLPDMTGSNEVRADPAAFGDEKVTKRRKMAGTS
jgi:hypothetical protein